MARKKTRGWRLSGRELRTVFGDPAIFAALGGIRLRRYQREPIRAIVRAVLRGEGGRFVILFPRQSGKNELQAQLEAYLLSLFSEEGGEIVKVSPTFDPQALTSLRRLERVLGRNPLTAGRWKRVGAAVIQLGSATISFMSGSPDSSIVGATASLLLEIDEAQDVAKTKFDGDIAPMAAARNAVIVFWGTAWTSDTLLARELRAAQEWDQRAAAGRRIQSPRHAYVLTADDVAREVLTYGAFVAEQVSRLGRNHPMIRTQFFSEEIDGQVGLFRAELVDGLIGEYRAETEPCADGRYFLLVDFAGSGETSGTIREDEPERDRTAVTIVRRETSNDGETIVWLPVRRFVWLDRPIQAQAEDIERLARAWSCGRVVTDATGIGAGPTSTLLQRLGSAVVRPFVFSVSSKSTLGWDFVALLESGRWREPSEAGIGDEDQLHYRDLFLAQLRAAQGIVSAGPEKRLSWSVPDGARDPVHGGRLHDDLVMSAALVTVLDKEFRGGAAVGDYGSAADPLMEMDHAKN